MRFVCPVELRAESRIISSAIFWKVKLSTLGKNSFSNLSPWITSYVTIAISLVVAEVGFIDALSFTTVVAIQTLGGVLVLSVLGGGRIEPNAECVGLGFALGSLLSTIADQVLIGTVTSGFAWLLPVVFGFVLHFFGPRSKARTKYFSIIVQKSDGHLLMPSAIVGVCFSLGLEWYWTLPIGAVLLPVLFVSEFKRISSRIRLQVYGLWGFVAIATLIIVLRRRPRIWWIEHTFDYVLFENWSNSISRFGYTGIGGEGFEFNYHWLSYAWNGLVSRVSLSEPWVATTRASVFVVALGIQLLLVALMKNYGLSTRAANVMATIAGLISTAPLWRYDSMHLLHLESFSAVFALVWLLAALLVALKLREAYSVRYAILFLTFCGATMGAKTAFGAVALAIIVALTIEKLLARDPRIKAFIFLSGASAVVIVLIAVFLFYDRFLPKIWGPHIGFIDFLGAMESENLLLRKPELILLAGWWISAGLLLQIYAVVVFCIRKNSDIKYKVLFEPILLILSLIPLLAVSFWDGNQNYFAYATFVILLPVTFQVVLSELRFVRLIVSQENRNFGKILVSILVAVALPVGALRFPEVGVATRVEVILRHTPYLTSLLAIAITTLFWISFSKKRLDQGRRLLVALGVWTLLLSSVSFYFSEWSNEVGKTYDRWTRESIGKIEQLYGSKETAEVIGWVNANTDPDSIVAFDYDLGDCKLDPWQIVESNCSSDSAVSDSDPHMSREVFEGAIRRRALLRNIHPLAFGRDMPMDARLREIEFRRQNIISYARNGDPASLEFLRDQSVEWFIASARNSTVTNWGRGTQVQFENSEFVVVRLRRSDS